MGDWAGAGAEGATGLGTVDASQYCTYPIGGIQLPDIGVGDISNPSAA